MNAHLFLATDGNLFDCRVLNWHKAEPLRKQFRFHHSAIENATQFKATLRAGAHAWPGGYPLFLICSDGGVLCSKCALAEVRQILPAIAARDGSGWRVVACEVNWEDSHLECEHCGEHIESAYAD